MGSKQIVCLLPFLNLANINRFCIGHIVVKATKKVMRKKSSLITFWGILNDLGDWGIDFLISQDR